MGNHPLHTKTGVVDERCRIGVLIIGVGKNILSASAASPERDG